MSQSVTTKINILREEKWQPQLHTNKENAFIQVQRTDIELTLEIIRVRKCVESLYTIPSVRITALGQKIMK